MRLRSPGNIWILEGAAEDPVYESPAWDLPGRSQYRVHRRHQLLRILHVHRDRRQPVQN